MNYNGLEKGPINSICAQPNMARATSPGRARPFSWMIEWVSPVGSRPDADLYVDWCARAASGPSSDIGGQGLSPSAEDQAETQSGKGGLSSG